MKPGDVVQLKSGGPKMTVEMESDDGAVWCRWFDGGHAQVQEFFIVTLTESRSSETAPKPHKPRRCACGHGLNRHTKDTVCLERLGTGAPCSGKCRVIEAGED